MYLDHPITHTRTRTRTPSPHPSPSPPQESPDIASLRRTHTTQGYRDGITAGKENFLQEGFDEGYTLGGRFGLKLGWILGVVEGLWYISREDGLKREAHTELTMEKIFSKEFFDEGGLWKYELGEGVGVVTLDRVVEGHPVVKVWVGRVKVEAERWGLVVGELEYEEGEGEGEKGEGEKEG